MGSQWFGVFFAMATNKKSTRMFDRRRHAMEISTSDHISVRRRSRSRVTASVASAAVPPRARGCVSMWGSPRRHATPLALARAPPPITLRVPLSFAGRSRLRALSPPAPLAPPAAPHLNSPARCCTDCCTDSGPSRAVCNRRPGRGRTRTPRRFCRASTRTPSHP
jgi:hypothetical protein